MKIPTTLKNLGLIDFPNGLVTKGISQFTINEIKIKPHPQKPPKQSAHVKRSGKVRLSVGGGSVKSESQKLTLKTHHMLRWIEMMKLNFKQRDLESENEDTRVRYSLICLSGGKKKK